MALITIPFDKLILAYSEIGIHRDRKHGLGAIFGFRTLRGVPFLRLAKKVKIAYLGEAVPGHKGWPAQREVLRWFVDKGPEALYQLEERAHVVPANNAYHLSNGNHRSLALYILGADCLRAVVGGADPRTISTFLGRRHRDAHPARIIRHTRRR